MAAVEERISVKKATGPSHEEALEKSLTQIVHDMIDAINAKSFEATSYPWTHLSDNFTGDLLFAGWKRTVDGRDAFAHYFKAYTSAHPDYSVRVVDTFVSITKRTGRAIIFANCEADGIPLGILRSSVGSWEFGPVGDGQWRCVSYRCVPGMNPSVETAAARVWHAGL